MRNTFKVMMLAMLAGQPLSAQTHTTKSSSSPLTWFTQTGLGIAGEFQIKNTANGNPALYAITNGRGPAGEFFTTGSSDGVAVYSNEGDAVCGVSETGNGATFDTTGRGDGVFARSC